MKTSFVQSAHTAFWDSDTWTRKQKKRKKLWSTQLTLKIKSKHEVFLTAKLAKFYCSSYPLAQTTQTVWQVFFTWLTKGSFVSMNTNESCSVTVFKTAVMRWIIRQSWNLLGIHLSVVLWFSVDRCQMVLPQVENGQENFLRSDKWVGFMMIQTFKFYILFLLFLLVFNVHFTACLKMR